MAFIPILDALTPIVEKALSYIPDPQQKAQQQEFLINALKDWDAQQSQINQAEATNENLFISGWRPFMGWVCGVAFAYHFILQPLLTYLMAACGHNFPLPDFDMSTLSTVLMGMLGLGGLRTVEKVQRMK